MKPGFAPSPLGAAIFVLALLAASPMAGDEPGFRITNPIPFQVIQRQGFDPVHAQAHEPGGPKLGFAEVPVAAELPNVKDGAAAEFRIVPQANAFGHGCDWTGLVTRVKGGRLATTVRVFAGGWYRMEIRCPAAGPEATVALEPFGVGEVLMIAGQSYAEGANAERLKVDDPQGRVVAYDVVKKSWATANDPLPNAGTGGTIWPSLGNYLLPLVRVPIGFVDVAVGGTASREWMPGEKLYKRLAAAGKAAGRFRAVLWQQGESDVIGKTSTGKYIENLTTIRRTLAEEWGFAPPWLPAKSTLHPTAYNDPVGEQRIRDAIGELWRRPGFRPGPDTDILGGENRGMRAPYRHFTGVGQRRAGLMWFACIWELLNDPALAGK